MAIMCPMCKLKQQSGMCIHEKMMIGIVIIIILLIIAKVINLF